MAFRQSEARAAVARRRASEIVAWTADSSEDIALPLVLQADWLRRRHGLSAEQARVIASLAFATGRRA